jgi:hypothetical protein
MMLGQTSLVRPMAMFVGILCGPLIALSALPVPKANSNVEITKHRLIYMFNKPGFVMVTVAIGEYESGARGTVEEMGFDRKRHRHPFSVSKAKFDKMWATLTSSGAEKYAGPEATGGFDSANYYMFWTGKQFYAVPKSKASPALASLAAKLEAYAK